MTREFCPYGYQPLLLATQILMGTTFVLSFGGWYMTWLFGFVAWILMMLLICIPVHRAALIASGVFALLAAVMQFVLAGASDVDGINIYCVNETKKDTTCDGIVAWLIAMGVITGLLWLVSAGLAFTLGFVLKDKEDRTRSAWAKQDGLSQQQQQQQQSPPPPGSIPIVRPTTPAPAFVGATTATTTATTIPVGSADATPPVISTTTETIVLPDGRTKIKETRINPDGSITTLEKIIAPA